MKGAILTAWMARQITDDEFLDLMCLEFRIHRVEWLEL